MLNENFLNKVKYLMIGTRAAGLVISHRLVIAIAKLAVKGNNPTMLITNGGPLKLIEDWRGGALKPLEWKKAKRKDGIGGALKANS